MDLHPSFSRHYTYQALSNSYQNLYNAIRVRLASKFLPIFAVMDAQDDLMTRWWTLEAKLVERFGKKPDMETILFLIGIQELGVKPKFTKEQKQDLMHIAVCALMSQSGYYELEGVDRDGWPHYKQLKSLPVMNMMEQENFMKDHILLYFDRVGF